MPDTTPRCEVGGGWKGGREGWEEGSSLAWCPEAAVAPPERGTVQWAAYSASPQKRSLRARISNKRNSPAAELASGRSKLGVIRLMLSAVHFYKASRLRPTSEDDAQKRLLQ